MASNTDCGSVGPARQIPVLSENALRDCKKSEQQWICPVNVCHQVLSRKQTLKTHLCVVHQIDNEIPSKQYKVYESDPSSSMPISTLYHKRKLENVTESEESVNCARELYIEPAIEDQLEIPPVNDCDVGYLCSDMEISSDDEMFASESSDSSDDDKCAVSSPFSAANNVPKSAPLYIIPKCDDIYSSGISQQEHLMSVAAFGSRHNLSDTALGHLVLLLDLHIPKNNLIEKDVNKLKEKCGFDCEFMNYFTNCNVCNRIFENDTDSCSTPNCNGQKITSSNQSYFATGSLDHQLRDILTREGIWETIQEIYNREQPSSITDITDGTEYKKLKQDGQFLSNRNNISLTMFTDGVPLFKSSGVSLWPVYLIINEIPRNERFMRKNMVLWGIWQGIGKPNMTIFLKPLVEDIQKIYHDGIKLTAAGEEIVCKAALVVVTMDLQARAAIVHMTQHNGEYSCVYCMHKGMVVKSGKGHCRCFPYTGEPLVLRTSDDIHRDGQVAQREKKRVNGFTGDSVLNYLPHFTLNNNIVVDYMHGLLLGIAKKFLKLWFDAKSANRLYFIGNRMREVDRIMKSITPPYLIKRLPRKLTNTMHHWKASELRSWLLFYALPCLNGILPDLYLKHFSTLVEATYILLGEGITESDLRRADLLLVIFVRNVDKLYEANVAGLNVHNLLHLNDCVRKWGPLWAWSCFCFESFNGEIKKSIHGTGNVCRQIFWSLQVQKRIENMTSQPLGHDVDTFVATINEGKVKEGSVLSAHQCLVKKTTSFPKNFDFPNEIKVKLLDMVESDDPSMFLKATKIIRNGFIIYSKLCTKVKKRNSYTVSTTENVDQGKFFEVEYFLVHKATLHVFAVGRKLMSDGGALPSNAPHLQHVQYFSAVLSVERATALQDVVVSFEVNGQKYVSLLPNTVEGD